MNKKLRFDKNEDKYIVWLQTDENQKVEKAKLSFEFANNQETPSFNHKLVDLALHIKEDSIHNGIFNLEVEELNDEQKKDIIFQKLHDVFAKFVSAFKDQYNQTRDELNKEFDKLKIKIQDNE
ncbi:hypothetical protein [Mycoplasma sp. E35C]|uniref:hypothetical protein n=1 Tax=Mycoplasma sp. E35C TaxID=2801918 RepID=UPI001CA3E490|nr:hypothetical protein [Mycoplasma sp. E35C]QZX49359.1 hypothetical protein JJE79_01245 [Mycoplasma sp. E35C]